MVRAISKDDGTPLSATDARMLAMAIRKLAITYDFVGLREDGNSAHWVANWYEQQAKDKTPVEP